MRLEKSLLWLSRRHRLTRTWLRMQRRCRCPASTPCLGFPGVGIARTCPWCLGWRRRPKMTG